MMDNETIAKLGFEAGADSVGFFTLKKFAELVAAHERNKLAAWMIQFGFATGHGDTMEELCDALGTEIVDRIDGELEAEREAIAADADWCIQNNLEQFIPERIRARST
jgi:hypothetical protein